MKKQVIVMGAGIGGLSAAIQLAHQGYQVTVLEKNSKPGGKIIQLKKNGFTFDGGASFITLSTVYDDFFRSVGKKREDYISWSQMKTNTTFHFANGKTFSLYTDEAKVRRQIAEKFPQDVAGFDRYMKVTGDIYALLYEGPEYAKRNYHQLFGFSYLFHKDVLAHLAKLTIHKSWWQFVRECFSSPELQSIFSYQATFMGMHPKQALATYSFLTWAEIKDGMFSVAGGTYGIVEGFYRLAKELGVKFVFDAEVTALNYSEHRITSVSTRESSYEADIFVNNIDGAYFYTHLMPKEKNSRYTDKKLRSMKHTNSYFTINLGLKQPIKAIDHHTFYVGKDWQEYFDILFQQNAVPRISDKNVCYYVIQPSVSEPWMAPAGKATLFILCPVPGYDPGFDWQTHEKPFRDFLIQTLKERDGLDLEPLIEEEIVYSPARWGSELNLWENVILGFSLNFFQINNFRMPNKAREFSNLYHAGASTIPGPGLPTCITSGRLVTERILEEESL